MFVLARKPLVGTVAENVLTWGTGALNVDGCRVAINTEVDDPRLGGNGSFVSGPRNTDYGLGDKKHYTHSDGRWPANTLLSADSEILREFPETTSGKPAGTRNTAHGYHGGWSTGLYPVTGFGDTGSAARFFHQFEYSEEDSMLFDDETPAETPKEIKLNGYLYAGDNLEYLRTLPDNSIDSIVTDPPYGLGKEPDPRKVLAAWLNDEVYQPGGRGFMGKEWDAFVPSPVLWQECLRVLKPGGHMIAFAGTRTYDWVVMGVRLAGFEIRDSLAWLYGCLKPSTKALTPDGPKDYRELSPGDPVVCWDPETREYRNLPIQEVLEYDYDGELRRWEVNGSVFSYTPNHRVLVGDEFVEAEKVSGDYLCRVYGGERVNAAFAGTERYQGKVWCLRVPTGAFVASENGVAIPTGNSGFPKSLNVGKALAKMAGAEREVIGRHCTDTNWRGKESPDSDRYLDTNANKKIKLNGPIEMKSRVVDITAPATPEAQQWEGWGTALKPALEPAVLARKPIVGTVAENVLTHGTGALNIDAARVEGKPRTTHKDGNYTGNAGYGGGWRAVENDVPEGRWPANVVHDGSEVVTSEFPETQSGKVASDKGGYPSKGETVFLQGVSTAQNQHGDSGSASRFFTQTSPDPLDGPLFKYCAKSSTSERNMGTEALQEAMEGKGNIHSTVKPLSLMEWLVKLVTPPGGVVLDPFLGSGTTAMAAELLGFRWIGCERETDYAMIAHQRISYVVENREEILAKREREKSKPPKAAKTVEPPEPVVVESPAAEDDDDFFFG